MGTCAGWGVEFRRRAHRCTSSVGEGSAANPRTGSTGCTGSCKPRMEQLQAILASQLEGTEANRASRYVEPWCSASNGTCHEKCGVWIWFCSRVVVILWRRVEIWYRTFIMFIGSWVIAAFIYVVFSDPLLFVVSLLMTLLMLIYRPPPYWRTYLPRLGRAWDWIRRAPTSQDH